MATKAGPVRNVLRGFSKKSGVERLDRRRLSGPAYSGWPASTIWKYGATPEPSGRVRRGSGSSAGRRRVGSSGGTKTVSSVSSVPRVIRKMAVPSTPNSASCDALGVVQG